MYIIMQRILCFPKSLFSSSANNTCNSVWDDLIKLASQVENKFSCMFGVYGAERSRSLWRWTSRQCCRDINYIFQVFEPAASLETGSDGERRGESDSCQADKSHRAPTTPPRIIHPQPELLFCFLCRVIGTGLFVRPRFFQIISHSFGYLCHKELK